MKRSWSSAVALCLLVAAGCSEGTGESPAGAAAEAGYEVRDGNAQNASAGDLDLTLRVEALDDRLHATVQVDNTGSEAVSVVGSCYGWSVDFGIEERTSNEASILEQAFWAAVGRTVGGPYSAEAWLPEGPRSCPGLDVLPVEPGTDSWTREWRSVGGGGPIEAVVRFEAAVHDGSAEVDVTTEADRLPQVRLSAPVSVPVPRLIADGPAALELLLADEAVVEWFDQKGERAISGSVISHDGSKVTFSSAAGALGNIEIVLDVPGGEILSVERPSVIDRSSGG